jgi:hypothetical protein
MIAKITPTSRNMIAKITPKSLAIVFRLLYVWLSCLVS